MTDPFNPYREWLGIEDGRQPGNYYELLGIAQSEPDPDAISHHAYGLIARVRRVRPGPHLAQWRELLDMLAAAKVCLLDPAARSAYDASLRAPPPPPAAPRPSGEPPPMVEVVTPPPPSTQPLAPLQAIRPDDSFAGQGPPSFFESPYPGTAVAPGTEVAGIAPLGPWQQPEVPPVAPPAPMPVQPVTPEAAAPASPPSVFPEYPQMPYGQAPTVATPAPETPYPQAPSPQAPMVPPAFQPGQGGTWVWQPAPAPRSMPGSMPQTMPYWGYPMPQPQGPMQAPGSPDGPAVPGQQVPMNPYSPMGMMPATPANPYGGMGAPAAPAGPEAPEEDNDWMSETFTPADSGPDWLDHPAEAMEPEPQQPWEAGPAPVEPPAAPRPWPAPAPAPVPPGAIPAAPMISMVPPASAPVVGPMEATEPQGAVTAFVPTESDFHPAPARRSTLTQTILRAMTILVFVLTSIFVLVLWKNRQRPEHIPPGPEEPATIAQGGPAKTPRGDSGQKSPVAGSAQSGNPAAKPNPKTVPGKENPKENPKPAEKKPEEKEKPKPDEKTEPGKEKTSKEEAKGPEKPEPPSDPRKKDAFKRALAGVRGAMARRDLAAAKQQLKLANQNVQGPADGTEFGRVESLLSNLEEFWKGMVKITASYSPAQEITIGNMPAIVVEAGPGRLTIRSEGRNQSFTLQTMPTPMVMALARSGFAKAASQKVLLGTFLAIDANGDKRLARQLWDEAAKAGEDLRDLLPELDQSALPPATREERKLAPTDAARLKKAQQAVHLKFQADFDQATNVPGKAALARKLLDAAGASDADAEGRYVMLMDAQRQAVGAGKAALTCEAIDGLAAYYSVDGIAMKLAALEDLAKTVRTIQSQKEVADCALKAAGQAIQTQQTEEAKKLAAVALAVARKSKSAALIRAVQAALQQLGPAPAPPGEEKAE